MSQKKKSFLKIFLGLLILFSLPLLIFFKIFRTPRKNLTSLISVCFSSSIAQDSSDLEKAMIPFSSREHRAQLLYTVQIKGGLDAEDLVQNYGICYSPQDIKILSQHKDRLDFSFRLKIEGEQAVVKMIQVQGQAQSDSQGKISYWKFSNMKTESGERCDFRSILNGFPR